MKGYGYGVWLVPNSDILKSKIRHIPHVTIMCNMEKKEAMKLHKLLIIYKKNIQLEIDGKCNLLSNDYDNDPLYGSGFNVKYNEFNQFKTAAKKFTGDFSFSPHLTFDYSKKKNDVKIQDITSMLVDSEICVADITHDDPNKWFIF